MKHVLRRRQYREVVPTTNFFSEGSTVEEDFEVATYDDRTNEVTHAKVPLARKQSGGWLNALFKW